MFTELAMRFEAPNPRNISFILFVLSLSSSPLSAAYSPFFLLSFLSSSPCSFYFDGCYKWDSQLVILHPEEPIQFETLKKILFEKSNIKANQATQQQVLSDTNFVHQTEKITQGILHLSAPAPPPRPNWKEIVDHGYIS